MGDTKSKSRKKTAETPEQPQKTVRQKMTEDYHAIHLQYEPSVMTGIDGIRFDFCHGFRMYEPETSTGRYVVELYDDEKGLIMSRQPLKPGGYLFHNASYYMRYMVQILDETGKTPLFRHTFNLGGRPVVVSFPQKTLGDTIAWFAACEEFRVKTGCQLFCAMHPFHIEMFAKKYPDIHFISFSDMENMKPYAHYLMGVSFDGGERLMPWDWRHQGLHHVGYNILGLDPYGADEKPPKIDFDHERREIAEPYVCIASLASGGCKLWLNPDGWDEVCIFLKKCGYRVLDIDANHYLQFNYLTIRIPREAEDFTGLGEGHKISDRAAMINHGDFFIGLGSGLSWVAWAVGKPVVLISGFSLPFCEFHTPYRVINTNVCHGCFNDTTLSFENNAKFWCPRQTDERLKMACSTAITSTQVINKILEIPAFQAHMEQAGLSVVATADGYDVEAKQEKKRKPQHHKE
ncbi:MAG: autotransporter strand-loop-strand O-heptosyltransferase [Victivallales bacterium]|nr:autotransporter strand-loop-strand O-heptosyltransferase [Victivallales bacterium]